jgi:hypothetical protein
MSKMEFDEARAARLEEIERRLAAVERALVINQPWPQYIGPLIYWTPGTTPVGDPWRVTCATSLSS